MTIRLARTRVKAAALALCGIAAIGVAVSAVSAPAVAAGRSHSAAVTTSASVPVVVNCAMHGQVRPREYTLPCADQKSVLTGLTWAAWGSSSAFAAAGINTFDDCIPNCAEGHFHSFPVLAALWRAEPWPGHTAQRYFTRLTLIYTGPRSYRAGGKLHVLPVTVTYPMSSGGGI
jgi:hypothetical protein